MWSANALLTTCWRLMEPRAVSAASHSLFIFNSTTSAELQYISIVLTYYLNRNNFEKINKSLYKITSNAMSSYTLKTYTITSIDRRTEF